jgi:hypothetical protein
MPILAPLADFAGVSRAVAVTAYLPASGLVNLVTPTSAVIMGGLALWKVGYDRYLKFVVGTPHSVIVHRADLAHERLSPSGCHELLFDDAERDARRARGAGLAAPISDAAAATA